MPDDLLTAWPHLKPQKAAAAACSACPRRAEGICALIRAEGLEHLVTQKTYQRRTMIWQVGEPRRFAVIFRSGVVSVARSMSGGRRQVIDFLMSGDHIGLAEAAGQQLTVSVLEDAEVCRLPIEALRDQRRTPAFMRGLIRLVEATSERVREHIVLLGKLRAEERVVAFLLRYRATSQRVQAMQARVDLPMTRRDIADHLGMAPETVCRALAWLQDQQLIVQIPDGVRIRDLGGLDRLASRGLHLPLLPPSPAAGRSVKCPA